MKFDKFTAFGYSYIHFAVEVMCFYVLTLVFKGGGIAWFFICLYDILAFALQPMIGAYCEKHPMFRPGILGSILLMIGAGMCLIFQGQFVLSILGMIALTSGNGLVHISGALATLRVSEGRLSESAIFVGGGSFGLITGRLLAGFPSLWWFTFAIEIIGLVLIIIIDKRIKARFGDRVYDFEAVPCKHSLLRDRDIAWVVLILGCVVIVRAFVGYGLPTAWNQTVIQTIFLYIFMGSGKMLGGVFADRFGAGNVGVVTCIVAVPVLLLSDNIMWLSLIGVALFSMTMAITLGGIVSAIPRNPGIAFGVTTIGLLLGTVPTFYVPMPGRLVCNILIVVMSIFAALGIWYCMPVGINGGKK